MNYHLGGHREALASKRDPQPDLFLARMAQGAQAVAYLLKAERRGYRPTASEWREILGSP